MKIKGAAWTGGYAEWDDGDTVYLSIAFTWLLDKAAARAFFWKALGKRVVAGGPALFQLKLQHVIQELAEIGKDYPDAVARHNPMATFASRGCPVGCFFCIVPKMEGKEFTLLPDFPVRPILCDNNLSALPGEYQDHIVRRYQQEGVPLLDANSGFEPATFSEEPYRRWEPINRGPWRYAYDEIKEREDVRRCCHMLREVDPRKKRVYVLIGNEPVASCLQRLEEVIAWGAEPHAQPYIKLVALEKTPDVRFDWSPQLLIDVARWANRRAWKETGFAGYDRSIRSERRPIEQEGLFT